jgi:hypothetical protein
MVLPFMKQSFFQIEDMNNSIQKMVFVFARFQDERAQQ